MEEHRYYSNLYHLSPPYPLTLLQFLKTKLQLGKRYVAMEVHAHNGQWTKLLYKHVHLMVSLCSDPNYQLYLQEQLADSDTFLSLNALPDTTTIDDDSIDCLCIDETFHRYDLGRMRREFERVLRLNSYVLIAQHERATELGSFTQAYDEWLAVHGHLPTAPPLPNEQQLEAFYDERHQQAIFENQQRLEWADLEAYTQTQLELYGQRASDAGWAALRALYDQHSADGRVVLAYHTHVYYGLFNYTVETIPWHENVLFTILRPFAFVLYLFLKALIYLGKGLKRLKNRLLPKHRSSE